jgi:hypothetical protein
LRDVRGTVGQQEGAAPLAVQPSLTTGERRVVRTVGLLPPVVAAVLFGVLAVQGRATLGDVAVAVVLYGGLLGLTAAVVLHERFQGRHCPRCDATGPRDRPTCGDCGYDLDERPLWRCDQRHRAHVEPGLCHCGRRLHRVEPIRGVDREVRRTLWAGAWIAAFLLGMVLLLPLVG